jgi:glycosyltransferase involved in cell wall biosynthesis
VRLSVVVPVLDEAERIGRQLADLGATVGIDEVVVVDGGSRDGTDVVRRAPGVRLIAPRGPRTQLNAGARAARGTCCSSPRRRDAARECGDVRAGRLPILRWWRAPSASAPSPTHPGGWGRCCASPTCARA